MLQSVRPIACNLNGCFGYIGRVSNFALKLLQKMDRGIRPGRDKRMPPCFVIRPPYRYQAVAAYWQRSPGLRIDFP